MNQIKNVEASFAEWLQETIPDSYRQYLGRSVSQTRERLKEINDYFPERDIFLIENSDPQEIIDFIKHKTNRKERVNNPDFVKYDTFHSNGIPKALIGKNHYFKFLQQKRDNLNNNPKDAVLKNLIATYKSKITSTKLKDEKYKWQFISEYQGRPDVTALNFENEINTIKWNNLTYQLSAAVLNHIGKERSEELRGLFKALFDNSVPLNIRIEAWDQGVSKLYRELNNEHTHHQDERAVSVYLALKYPDQYTFYKSSYYKKFCDLLGIQSKSKGEKYNHYLELVNMLVDNYISKDESLTALLKELIPEYYDGSNNLLVAQDILYQTLDKEREINYWVFQGNPDIYNIPEALKANHLKSWKVSAHKNKIKPGDKVIIWQTGNNSGCYALAEVASEVAIIEEESSETQYYADSQRSENLHRVRLNINNNFGDAPVLWSQIKDLSEFVNFKAGNQGTNFRATEEEYNALLTMIESKNVKYWLYAPGRKAEHWDEFYDLNILAIGWDALGNLKQYKSRAEIRDALRAAYGGDGNKMNNVTANDEFANKINIGDVIMVKQGRGRLLGYGIVSSDYYHDDQRENYKSCRAVDWKLKGSWDVDHSLVLKTLTDVTKYESESPEHEFYYQYLMGVMQGKINEASMKNKLINPRNQILYGPPGTGKTYALKKTYFPRYTLKEASITRESFFEETVRDLTWWQVIALALMELGTSRVNEILENRWVASKANMSESKNVRATLWGTLQMHTVQESETVAYKQRQIPLIFDKNQNKSWSLLETELREQFPDLYDILESVNNFTTNPQKEIKHYVFTTFHQSFAYEDFIEGIKPKLNTETENNELSYQIQNGVFKELCLRAQSDPENRYAIFIDEINRGNVSAIFGELITLIEADKRIGAKNEIKVRLPYSKTDFGVPSNVDIYGTMNTADRSVEALDTALRRRFSFIEIMPKSLLLEAIEFNGFNLKEVLETINERIEFLLDRDHTIGHSYFMNLESDDTAGLEEVFKNKVIPLLQEYFYHDYEKIALILGAGFVSVKTNHEVKFPKFEGIADPDNVTLCELVVDIDDIEESVLKLLNRNAA